MNVVIHAVLQEGDRKWRSCALRTVVGPGFHNLLSLHCRVMTDLLARNSLCGLRAQQGRGQGRAAAVNKALFVIKDLASLLTEEAPALQVQLDLANEMRETSLKRITPHSSIKRISTVTVIHG